MYKILYMDLEDSKGFLRRQPGKKPYICFDSKLKSSPERALNVLIPLMDADRLLTKRQKVQEQRIYVEDVPDSYPGLGRSVAATGKREADFCWN